MGDGGDVTDGSDLQSKHTQRSDGALTANAWSLHKYVHFLQSAVHSSLGCLLGSGLCCIGGGLLGTAEPKSAGTCPRYRIPVEVGYGNNGIVEGRLNIDVPFIYRLLTLRFAVAIWYLLLISS